MSKISKVDENLVIESSLNLDDVIWYPVTPELFTVKGVEYTNDGFIRMDRAVAASVSELMEVLNTHTSGGRVFFETDASYVALKVKSEKSILEHMPLSGSHGFDLYVDEGEGYFNFNIALPPRDFKGSYEKLIEFETNRHYKLLYRKMKRKMQLYFPLYAPVKELYIGLPKDASLEKFEPYDKPPVVYYGSSVTQGGCASRPGNHFPALISRKTNTDFINLGFSGNAHGEVQVAEYIANLDMSLFVMDYDGNDFCEPELLKERHMRFYDIIRKKHKDMPIIIATHLNTLRLKDVLSKSREVIYESYLRAKNRGDNVYFVDNHKAIGEDFIDCATVDGCHPNDFGFVKMADNYLKTIEEGGIL